MKKQLLKEFFAFIVATMMFSVSAKAQIVYTDIVPDSAYIITNLRSDTFNLDLNGDSTTDFVIKASRPRPRYPEDPVTSSVNLTPQGNNAFKTTTLNTVKKLVAGDAISSSQAWHDATLQYLKWYQTEIIFTGGTEVTNMGEWDNVLNGYVGLRFISGGQTYYGWVRMDVNVSTDSASMTIKDYAYNSIPNQPILAGQTMTTGIIENTLASSMNLFPNPASDELTTDFTLVEPADVQFGLYDIVGNYIVLASEENYAAGPHRKQMKVEQVPSGIYQLTINTNKSVISRKVIVQH